MRAPSRTIAVILLVALAAPNLTFGQTVPAKPGEIVRLSSPVTIIEDDDGFRKQMLEFLNGMDVALTRMAQHPALADTVRETAVENGVQIPFDPEIYDRIHAATSEELGQLRGVLAQAPGLMNIPPMLESVTDTLPKDYASQVTRATRGVACPATNTTSQSEFVSLQGQVRALTRGANSLDVIHSIFDTIVEAANAASQDANFGGFWRSVFIVLLFIRGPIDVARQSVRLVGNLTGSEVEFRSLCLASCLRDQDDEHGDASMEWRGRGCDNRDNNCNGTIDELSEDLFPPVISVDTAILGQCFSSTAAAQLALGNAVNATDDCSATIDTAVVAAPVNCKSGFTVTSKDGQMNTSSLVGPTLLTIDPTPPIVATPTLQTCYATLDAARAAFVGPGFSINECDPAPGVEVDVVEKECVADLSVTVTDSCDNQTTVRDTARVDGSAPVVNIERLTIPDVDGLSCFASEAEAVANVQAATRISDQCTAVEDLVVSTTTSGTQCDLNVRTAARDDCGNVSADDLTVRVDNAPPVVTCSLVTTVLYPATDEFVDVGFSMTATDECDPAGPQVDVQVTSDEATALAFSTKESEDAFPDAILDEGPDGAIVGIRLRAQRSKLEGADGRVYMIRVTATDSCGLQSVADCFVTVPRQTPGPASAINTGQVFDATTRN